MTPTIHVIPGDCLDVLKQFDENSFDACVTDPPYLLGFMSREFDLQHKKEAARSEGEQMYCWHLRWAKEVLRVLKPGAHLLAFGGTRTSHRLACAVEDAGFELRDTICWLYGTGFPKGQDIGKAIDQMAGMKREIIGKKSYAGGHIQNSSDNKLAPPIGTFKRTQDRRDVTIPVTDAANKWNGWNTALKPAFEPIIVARKPISEKTVAANVLRWGTGAINVDKTRIESGGTHGSADSVGQGKGYAKTPNNGILRAGKGGIVAPPHPQGRWPANVVLSHLPSCRKVGLQTIKADGHHPKARGKGGLSTSGHKGQLDLQERKSGRESIEKWECVESCPVAMLDWQSGPAGCSFKGKVYKDQLHGGGQNGKFGDFGNREVFSYDDSGGASRFFLNVAPDPPFLYCGKASRKERGKGNDHPTVKSIKLMKWLIRLVTPPGGILIDPFAGSGTTGLAARAEGFESVLIEREPDYISIIERRIAT